MGVTAADLQLEDGETLEDDPLVVLVLAPAACLLEGSGLSLEDAGEHELKGLSGGRRLYRLAAQETD